MQQPAHGTGARGWSPEISGPVRAALVVLSCVALLVFGPSSSRSVLDKPQTGQVEVTAPARGDHTLADASSTEFLAPAAVEGLHFASAVELPSAGFITNAPTRSFPWTGPKRTLREAMNDAFAPGRHDWPDLVFHEGSGTPITAEVLFHWLDSELLVSPGPFADHGGEVPLPWNGRNNAEDQLDPGQWVGYSRRQVCYIVAKTLMGCGTNGYNNGFLRFAEKKLGGGSMARTGDFGRSWWYFLAACAADPSLSNGAQGPLLLAVKGGVAPDVSDVRGKSKGVLLSAAKTRICHYNDGNPLPPGLQAVPSEGCQPPTASDPGKDFMTGGLPGQATQDISAAWLGGYVFGNADGIGGGQDERLMVYFPEVALLTFFLSQNPKQDPEAPQLRQPAWILGARMMGKNLDGSAQWDLPIIVNREVPFTSDLVPVNLGGKSYLISSSRPFLGFQSENQDFIPGSGSELRHALHLARRNKEPSQRNVRLNTPYNFEKQVRAWYRSVSLDSYDPAVRPVLQTLVRSVGVGPWLAGLWFGDSQLGFLASWLGHAIAAPSWGGNLPLDYYIYRDFTENPGNQCFVLRADQCRSCLEKCLADPLSPTAYWLPGDAYMGSNSCVQPHPDDCGLHGIEDIISAFSGTDAAGLWSKIEEDLSAAGQDTSRSVFDIILGAASA